MMDRLWSETCWSTFKYFIILIVSTYYILCISWIIKCLIPVRYLLFKIFKSVTGVIFRTVQKHTRIIRELTFNKTFFDVLLTVHISIFISVINQLDVQNFCFTVSLFHASTCFDHMCSKHVEAWNRLIVKQKFCASSWLINQINTTRHFESVSSNCLASRPIISARSQSVETQAHV